MTVGERVKQQLDDTLEKLPELFVLFELEERVDDRTPFTSVFLQECERMNRLLGALRRTCGEQARRAETGEGR